MSKTPSPYEIVTLFGSTPPLLAQGAESLGLFHLCFLAVTLKDQLEKRKLLDEVVRQAAAGDQAASQALVGSGFDIRLSDDLRAEAEVLALALGEAMNQVAQGWAKWGAELERIWRQAYEERRKKYGLVISSAVTEFIPTGPTLEEVARELRDKKETLLLLQSALEGDRSVWPELKKKRILLESWQTKELGEQIEYTAKQVREAESRFEALRSAAVQKEAQAQQELTEQITSWQKRRREMTEEIAALEEALEKLTRGGVDRTAVWEDLRAKKLMPRVEINLEATVAQGLEERRQYLTEIDQGLQRLSETAPQFGQRVEGRLAGVNPATVPQLALSRDLVFPHFNFLVLGQDSGPAQWLVVNEARWQLGEEAAQLEGYLLDDPGAVAFWRSRGVPEVWSRRDTEAALWRREELLSQLQEKDLELAGKLEPRAQELKEGLKEMQQREATGLLIEEEQKKLTAMRGEAQIELAQIWAGKRQRAKFEEIYGS